MKQNGMEFVRKGFTPAPAEDQNNAMAAARREQWLRFERLRKHFEDQKVKS